MRASKAYIAGLGTTGVLLASSILLLFVVGAVVAFNGSWVSRTLDQLEGLVVDRDRPLRLADPGSGAVDAAPSAVEVAARPLARARRARAIPAPAPAVPTPVEAGTPIAGVASAGAGGGGGAPLPEPPRDLPIPPPPVPPPPPPEPLIEMDPTLGDVTERLTDTVGEVVDVVDPRLGSTVKTTGADLGAVVDDLTGARQPSAR